MTFRSALATFLLMTLPAWGAGKLETLRAQAQSAREQVGSVRSEQMGKRKQLNQLSAQIETLKAEAKGKLLPGGQLDAALKQSQELSGALTALAQTMSSRETELEQANLALLEALSVQLTQLRADFDRQTERAARQKILGQFKALRAEREQVRAALPAAKVPALEALKFSEDPTELLEQADAVRDNEDKVRRELKALETRIAEAKSERDLDGRFRQFLGEESMFDDADRRIRIRRETTEKGPLSFTEAPNDNQRAGSDPAGDSAFQASPFPFGGASPAKAGEQQPPPGAGSPTTKVTKGSDARPNVGNQRIAGGDDDDLEELEVQRLKLQGLAGQLREKAIELEKKAAQLK